MTTKMGKFSPGVRERAVRMVLEWHRQPVRLKPRRGVRDGVMTAVAMSGRQRR